MPSKSRSKDEPCGDGREGRELPFPNSDFPPALQRTLERKMREERESGCEGEEGATDEEFTEALRKVARHRRSG
jgi:hypothetical protein